jgi:signal transduction histidine kinase
MRERAAQIGASLSIRDNPPRGTTIELQLPFAG